MSYEPIDDIKLPPRKGDIVRAETSAGIARAKGWVTRVISGEVMAITEKAMLIRGTADVYTDDGCMICGRTLTKFTSRAVYIGPVCASKNGLYYPTDEELSDAHKEEIRSRIQATWAGEAWMPRAYTKFTVLEEAPRVSHLSRPHDGSSDVLPATGIASNSKIDEAYMLSQKPENASQSRDTAPPAPERVDVRFSIDVLSTAKHRGRYIVCRSQFEHREKAKGVAGRVWDGEVPPCPPAWPRAGGWVYPVEAIIALRLKEAFAGLVRRGTPSFTDLLKQSASIVEADAIKQQDAESLPKIPLVKTEPWNHQTRAFGFVTKLWGGLPDDPEPSRT